MTYGHTPDTFHGIPMSMQFVDSPSTTSATTYSVSVGGNGSTTIYINRVSRDNDGTNEDARTASSIILMEIGG